jgi:uncharacterized membrane-anchored protein
MKTSARSFVWPHLFAALAVCMTLGMSSTASAQDLKARLPNIKWQDGPGVGNLGGMAEVQVPEGYIFADGQDTRRIMEAMQNPPTGIEMGFIAPARSARWFLVFEFDEVGYVKDDEKHSLDANAMLDSIKKGNERGNEERKKRGWSTLTITGWQTPPTYNSETHNLEWGINAVSDGHTVTNYNTRILGRRGVMKVTLVGDPAEISAALPHARTLLGGYAFRRGHKYAEWVKGDKVAQYGLAALIVGGAGAAAVKSGLFKWLWKVLVVAAIGAAGLLKRVFTRSEA